MNCKLKHSILLLVLPIIALLITSLIYQATTANIIKPATNANIVYQDKISTKGYPIEKKQHSETTSWASIFAIDLRMEISLYQDRRDKENTDGHYIYRVDAALISQGYSNKNDKCFVLPIKWKLEKNEGESDSYSVTPDWKNNPGYEVVGKRSNAISTYKYCLSRIPNRVVFDMEPPDNVDQFLKQLLPSFKKEAVGKVSFSAEVAIDIHCQVKLEDYTQKWSAELDVMNKEEIEEYRNTFDELLPDVKVRFTNKSRYPLLLKVPYKGYIVANWGYVKIRSVYSTYMQSTIFIPSGSTYIMFLSIVRDIGKYKFPQEEPEGTPLDQCEIKVNINRFARIEASDDFRIIFSPLSIQGSLGVAVNSPFYPKKQEFSQEIKITDFYK